MSNLSLHEIARSQVGIFLPEDPVVIRSVIQLMRLLLDGGPVPVERFGAAAALSPTEADAVFAKLRAWGVEFNEAGHVVGAGLTLVPTPHRYNVEGHTFYTWCAQDAVIFPLWLDHTATIVSPDPVSGDLIQLTVGSQGVVSFEPESAVVSLRSTGCDAKDVRGSVCQYGHFFASRDTAAAYSTAHDGVLLEILTPEETFRMCQIETEAEPLKSIMETV